MICVSLNYYDYNENHNNLRKLTPSFYANQLLSNILLDQRRFIRDHQGIQQG